jgi:hypothetical protein
MKPMSDLERDPIAFIQDLIIPTREGPRRFGDVMQPYQQAWLDDLAPDLLAVANGEPPEGGRHWWEASKGCSKTSMVAAAVLWLSVFSKRPIVMQAGAVDRDNAAELVKSAKAILHENPWLAPLVDVQNWAIVGRQFETACEIVAADKAGSHGAKPALVFIDECGHVPDERFEFVSNMLDNSAKVAGIVICATNAGWTGTEAFKLREIVRTSPRWRFHQWAQPSPLMDPVEVEEAAKRNTPSRQLRLYWGVWGPKDEGDALPPDDIKRAVRLRGPTDYPARGVDYLVGLDLSSKRDHSAAVLVGADATAQVVRLCQCLSWSPADNGGRVDLAAVRDAVTDLARRFGAPVLYDPHNAALMVQDFQRAGVHAVEVAYSAANLSLMASSLMQAFRDGKIELYDDAALIADLHKLSIEERGPFGLKLTAPADRETGHADRAFALATCLPAALELLQYGGIIDFSGQPPIELDGPIIDCPIPAYSGLPNPLAAPSPGNLPGFGAFGGSMFGGRNSRF